MPTKSQILESNFARAIKAHIEKYPQEFKKEKKEEKEKKESQIGVQK